MIQCANAYFIVLYSIINCVTLNPILCSFTVIYRLYSKCVFLYKESIYICNLTFYSKIPLVNPNIRSRNNLIHADA